MLANINNLFIILFTILLNINLIGQNSITTFPIIRNFKRAEYNAGMQIWMISQAQNNLMYFANNYGLVEFDGHNWELYGMENYTIVRSVLAASDSLIYIGLSNNFGYFVTDSTGKKDFHSLKHLLPNNITIDEIWRIHITTDGVIYQTFKELIVYKNGKITIYNAPTKFFWSFKIQNKLYITDWKEGILEFKNGKFYALKGTEELPNSEVVSILPYGKYLMIITMGKGIFIYKDKKLQLWDNDASKYISEHQAYSAIRIDENRIAFGTIQKGLLIADNEGNILTKIDKKSGLQNNTILSMTLDKSGNLWLGTNNGIDIVYINSPISQLGFNLDFGSGYSIAIYNDIMYLGTNQGLYYKNLKEGNNADFKPIKRLKGQVWSLKVIDNQLFCGHNKGAYLVKGVQVEKLSIIPGVWMFMQSEKYPDRIIAGTYTGLMLLQKTNEKWKFVKKLSNFEESSRMMFFDDNEIIWMSHGFKGVYKIQLNESYDSVIQSTLYNSANGFQNNYGINIAKLQNQIIFLAKEGIYAYDDINDIMTRSEYFENLFDHKETGFALEDIYGNIWHFGDYSMSLKLIKKDGLYSNISIPFKQLNGHFIEGFQFVYPIDKSNFLICYEDGFINYNSIIQENKNIPFNLYINKVVLSNIDSTIYEGHLFSDNKNNRPTLKYDNNDLRFYYSIVHFENPQKVEFSNFLEGYDKEWSSWESRYDREFTNLNEGEYAFHIRAKSINGQDSKSVVYFFTISPPWTRTKKAIVIYIVLTLLVVFILIFAIRKRIAYLKKHEEKIQKLKFIEREKELQQEALLKEKEIIRLRNEQLRDKLKTKDKELANSTMQTIKTNKFLISLKKDMQKNNAEMISEIAKSQNKKLVRKIDNEINNEKNWRVFETHFGNVHEEFLIKLKKEHPQLSPAELRLCACLRMNISSKEIASLLNISVRGVEASRYRLRKSLDLDRSANLTDFILSL